ncbi:MAG: universal stress protein [Anaerolineae bacterium]|nr:universal stress protein [Anaerolineae bacterium]
MISTILCATRGGEASVRTQMRAIELARERGASLLFLYVADVRFLDRLSGTMVVDVATELEHMGEFLLLMAKERAEKAGVEAATVVKRGEFRDALVSAAQEAEASLIVLGSPEEGGHTQRDFLEALAASISEECGIETIIV